MTRRSDALLGIVISDEALHEAVGEGAAVTVDVQNRFVSVEGVEQKFPFALTELEESFLNGGGLKNLFKRYKKDLFRASLQAKSKSNCCGSKSITSW